MHAFQRPQRFSEGSVRWDRWAGKTSSTRVCVNCEMRTLFFARSALDWDIFRCCTVSGYQLKKKGKPQNKICQFVPFNWMVCWCQTWLCHISTQKVKTMVMENPWEKPLTITKSITGLWHFLFHCFDSSKLGIHHHLERRKVQHLSVMETTCQWNSTSKGQWFPLGNWFVPPASARAGIGSPAQEGHCVPAANQHFWSQIFPKRRHWFMDSSCFFWCVKIDNNNTATKSESQILTKKLKSSSGSLFKAFFIIFLFFEKTMVNFEAGGGLFVVVFQCLTALHDRGGAEHLRRDRCTGKLQRGDDLHGAVLVESDPWGAFFFFSSNQ